MQDHTISDVNWDTGPVLSTEIFTASVTYDALSRPVTSTDPGGNITVHSYDKSGALVKVVLNGTEHVQNIKYDAKGQRQSVLYGNNTVTKYTYDVHTFRLKTLLTTGNSGAIIYQGLNYYYDPVGNITTITDSAQQTLYFNNTVVSPTLKYTYDALYRLIKAQGRELIGTASFGTDDNTQDTAWKTIHKGDGSAVQSYTQNYTYDAVGNILSLQHIAGTGSYTRTFNIGTANNRLTSTVVGANTYNYTHDVRGNISVMPHLSTMGWNQQNGLKYITKGTMSAWYQYGGGQRIRKYVNKAGIKEERIYLGNYEIYRKFDASSLKIVERITLHVSDDTGRIVMLENRTFGTPANDNNTAASLTRYIYSNHLQSSSLELDGSAAIISYEEYHPYGTTSYQAMNASIQAVAKRYRYTGKERDEESGLYYHGARYYIPWLCRWVSVDPLESKYAGMSPYNYSFNNPLVFSDPSGMGPDDPPQNYNTPPAIDNTRVYKVNPYEETAPAGYLTPDGGRIRLPQGTAIGDTVSETGEYRIDGQNVILSPGGVLSFTLEGNTYNAQFGDDNKFVGYYTNDRSNYVTYEGKSVPFKLNTREAGAFMLAGWTAAGQTALADGPEPGPADIGGAIVGVGTTILSGLFLFDAASGNISMTRPVAIPIDLTSPKPNEDKGTIIYRSMKMDNMGMPIEEESARGLGVRVNGDIPVIEGMVSPFTGGMSVAPDDPKNLPLHRRPANLGGTGKDPVFVMNTKDLPYGLMYDPDKPDHGTIQPAFPMPYEAYKALLSTTKLLWKPYGK